jgi:alpha-beta hydrolase superfamily lysophospholipase
MIEKEFEVHSAGATLSGTLCLPAAEGRFPLVLMIHGSGPLDRDENAKGLTLDVFNTLAHHLCAAGIASLRYDKRGCGRSTGDYHSAGHRDLVDDAIACFDAVVQTGSCRDDQIYVLGHSEGTIMAPQLAIARPSVAGLILLSPFVQPLETILIRQAGHFADAIARKRGLTGFLLRLGSRLRGGPVKVQRKTIRRVKASTKPTIRFLLHKLPARWLREMLALDPESIYRSVVTPLLLIGGDKDVQCDPADVDRIASLVKGPADAHVLRDLTHILRRDPEPASIFRYRKLLKEPVDQEVLTLVTDWLEARLSGSG